jgi:hypothetical protein
MLYPSGGNPHSRTLFSIFKNSASTSSFFSILIRRSNWILNSSFGWTRPQKPNILTEWIFLLKKTKNR